MLDDFLAVWSSYQFWKCLIPTSAYLPRHQRAYRHLGKITYCNSTLKFLWSSHHRAKKEGRNPESNQDLLITRQNKLLHCPAQGRARFMRCLNAIGPIPILRSRLFYHRIIAPVARMISHAMRIRIFYNGFIVSGGVKEQRNRCGCKLWPWGEAVIVYHHENIFIVANSLVRLRATWRSKRSLSFHVKGRAFRSGWVWTWRSKHLAAEPTVRAEREKRCLMIKMCLKTYEHLWTRVLYYIQCLTQAFNVRCQKMSNRCWKHADGRWNSPWTGVLWCL